MSQSRELSETSPKLERFRALRSEWEAVHDRQMRFQ